MLESKQNSETVWRGFKIPLYAEEPPYELWFISEAADNGYIVGPQKKSVAIYVMGEKRFMRTWTLRKRYYNDWPHFIQVFTMRQPHGLLLCFILLYISNSSVSTLLVGHVLYSADLMSTICIPHILLMVHQYIYSRCKGTSRVVLSKFWGSILLMAQWQIMYCTPIISDFSCLCHVVQCLLLVVLEHSVIIDWLPWCCVPDYLV